MIETKNKYIRDACQLFLLVKESINLLQTFCNMTFLTMKVTYNKYAFLGNLPLFFSYGLLFHMNLLDSTILE